MNLKTLTLMGTVLVALNSQSAEAKVGHKFQETKSVLSKKPGIAEVIEFVKTRSRGAAGSAKSSGGLFSAKTTATKSRVVAYAYREFGTTEVQDTARLFYASSDRGSDLPNQIIKFDSLVAYTYDMTTSSLVRDYFVGQTFDASDNIQMSTEKYWEETLMSYENDTRTTNTYNTANKIVSAITETWDGSAWINEAKLLSKYDAAQNKLSDSSFEWNGSGWEAYYTETNTYTATNKLASTSYHYYESTLGMWLNIAAVSYTYDASDYLTSSLRKMIDMTSFTLEDYSRSFFTNDASGNPLVTLQEKWDDVLSAWANDLRIYSTYDAAKNKTSEVYSNWNDVAAKFDTNSAMSYTYNTYNQVKTEVYSNWDMGAGALVKNDSTTYYYEEHTPTSINDVVKNSVSKVYPVPANNELTVSANIGEAQKIQVLVSDIQGRPLIHINQNSGVDFNQKISVMNVPSGTYILSVAGDKGFKSVQTIMVTH